MIAEGMGNESTTPIPARFLPAKKSMLARYIKVFRKKIFGLHLLKALKDSWFCEPFKLFNLFANQL